MPPTRRETEDEAVKEYLLDLAAKEAERQIQEDALAAFPNSRAREGGVAHFYFHEGSSSEESPDDSTKEEERGRRRARRRSSSIDLNWWQRHMKQHAEQLADKRAIVEVASTVGAQDAAAAGEDIDMTSDSELDKMDLSAPPDPMWTTSTGRQQDYDRRDSMAEQAEARKWAVARVQHKEAHAPDGSQTLILGPAREPVPDRSQAPTSHLPQDPGNRNQQDPFGRQFASLGIKPDVAQLRRLRKLNSPPMLGKELQFRNCPSPKQTRLETDHPFVRHENGQKQENRDMSGQGGLWRGYCCRSEATGGYLIPAELHPPDMMATPRTPGTPREAFAHEIDNVSIYDEPPSLWGTPGSSASNSSTRPVNAEHRQRNGEPKGIHMLHGLDERLQQEKVRAERNEKIAQEFNDEFVTQVYNYLSLGYPAMARSFDDELSKISRVSIDDLTKDDAQQMAKGHMLEMNLGETQEEQRCPRWKALRVYILEWARQHPDLDNLNPLAWGVHERRGSWAN